MKKLALILMTLAVLASCKKTEEPSPTPEPKPEPELVPIQIATTMTRATDYAFKTSDKVGLFVVNEPKNLQASGNHVDNCKFTFDGAKWNPGTRSTGLTRPPRRISNATTLTPRSRMSMNMPSRLGRIRAPRP